MDESQRKELERIKKLTKFWIKQTEPPNPHQYDAYIQLFPEDALLSARKYYGHVQWSPLRKHYEMLSVEKNGSNVYVESHIVLESADYETFTNQFKAIGIREFIRFVDKDKPAEPESDLQGYLAPQLTPQVKVTVKKL